MTPLILTSCGEATFDTSQSQGLVLPGVVQYSRETQIKAAQEAITGSCPVHVDFGKDYKVMRDQVRLAEEFLK